MATERQIDPEVDEDARERAAAQEWRALFAGCETLTQSELSDVDGLEWASRFRAA
jgi:hypothetical protein